MAKLYNVVSNHELGRYLRYYRNRAGMTAADAAEQAGFANAQSIFNLESGKSKPDFPKVVALLEVYNVPYDDAFTEPLEVVMNPSRRKKPGSVRLRELTKIFEGLSKEDQKFVLRIARTLSQRQSEGTSEADGKDPTN